jgi:alkaline phosphatase
MPEQAESAANKTLILTDYEVAELKKAYDITLKGGFGTDADGKSLQTPEEYLQYGTYTPFSVTVTHLLNNKSGINFSSYSHTGLPAAVYASGVGQDLFVGGYDNTELYNKMAQLLGIN